MFIGTKLYIVCLWALTIYSKFMGTNYIVSLFALYIVSLWALQCYEKHVTKFS